MKKELVENDNKFEKVHKYASFLRKLETIDIPKSKSHVDRLISEHAMNPSEKSIWIALCRNYEDPKGKYNLARSCISIEHIGIILAKHDGDVSIVQMAKEIATYNHYPFKVVKGCLQQLIESLSGEFLYFEKAGDSQSRLMGWYPEIVK